ncbi:MAG TPA: GMC family oxidoreductase [Ferruginibacter sp.]|nr:GMC family oxidoreductase [Ferruginibacter sp.]HRO06076.1 GMC family oxidoreductase [Ferruginibacter sp.]HRO95669.1 GMC family oxidoreductase [Ferruginibacter sp.]HRP49322.1 GMC family oxidoreductase [Ferruginibacter sp.]
MGNPVQDKHTYDAIVVGSGISGGWAAMELSKLGMKTLLLERGRNVEHVVDYPTAMMRPWDFPNRTQFTEKEKEENPVQSLVYDEGSKHFFVSDKAHPYIQSDPFAWIRGYQMGGRSLTWGRQTYRLSDLDFEANLKDGHGVDWPIRYKDIEPWYTYVEEFIGVSGQAENLPQLPDGSFLPPMELNCVETYFAEKIRQKYPDRLLTIARVANLTRGWNNRGACQYRNACMRGCPFGGYFSSNSSTIPAGLATGNLTIRPHSIVHEIIYDDTLQKATGVRVIDELTKETFEYKSRIIFLNASTIASASILLQSVSKRFPEGLGNDSGMVGRNLMDHHSGSGATGIITHMDDKYFYGRRPAGFLIPRFRNIDAASTVPDFVRGYNFQGDGERHEWQDTMHTDGLLGESLKKHILKPGPWSIWMAAWGECLPNPNNRITLHPTKKDQWGLPLVDVHFNWGENEKAMWKDAENTAAEMMENAGFENVAPFNYKKIAGISVHEMGTARMGKDPSTSVLNRFNQVHTVPNLFVTDGSCMTSSACQNPSLTYMALTARACHFAAKAMKSGQL